MTPQRTGREPFLSGAPMPIEASGHEPGLGGDRLVKLYRDHLLHLLTIPATSHLRRAAIGDWLSRHGDPRPGVGLGPDGLPEIAWCAVPTGLVQIRDTPEPVPVGRFVIARYPVTWAQYRIFLEAEDGHADPQWWDGLRRRAEYEREAIKTDNYPAQEVSWYDAVAYCRWLSTRLGLEVRLPTEWEWQQAATGGQPDTLYPWGSDWHPYYANTRESGLRRVTAVGLYPMGESPVGALDMCGTVLEWCANEFALPTSVDPGSAAHRVLKGGSWFLTRNFAYVHFRTGDDPYYRFNSVGFRLVADRMAADEPAPRRAALSMPPAEFHPEGTPTPDSPSESVPDHTGA